MTNKTDPACSQELFPEIPGSSTLIVNCPRKKDMAETSSETVSYLFMNGSKKGEYAVCALMAKETISSPSMPWVRRSSTNTTPMRYSSVLRQIKFTSHK